MTALFDPSASGGLPAGLWLRNARDRLDAAGIETAALDARMLLLDGLGIPHSVFIADPNLALQGEEAEKLEAMLSRRENREPVSRILGWREFYGRRFEISGDVLDPRPDTETLVKAALDAGAQRFGADHPCRILDMGTGSGCIVVSLLAERPLWSGVASDLSAGALEIARRNAVQIRVSDRLELVETSWAHGIEGKFDLVVSNPPYIRSGEMSDLMPEVKQHDPRLALEAGADGLDAYRAILGNISELLSPDGLILLEVGADQAADVGQLAKDAGLTDQIGFGLDRFDLGGHERVVVAGKAKN